jgi:hypothetical protein
METGYQDTISGLLRKRGELLASMADLREQIAVLPGNSGSASTACFGIKQSGKLVEPSHRLPAGTLPPSCWAAASSPIPCHRTLSTSAHA